MNIFKKWSKEAYTPKQTFRFAKVSFFTGVILTTAFVYVAIPKITTFVEEVSTSFNPPQTYTKIEVSEDGTNTERIEQYYQEEYAKLEDQYRQMHEDKARLNAIERVEDEFEAEKEEIRAREILPLAQTH